MPSCRSCGGTGQKAGGRRGETESGMWQRPCHACNGSGWVAGSSSSGGGLNSTWSNIVGGIVAALMIVALVLGARGCFNAMRGTGHELATDVPESEPLPIDGPWETTVNDKKHPVTISKGRIFFDQGQKVIVKNLKLAAPKQYTGEMALVVDGRFDSYVPMSLDVISETEVRADTPAVPEKRFKGASETFTRVGPPGK